VIEYFRKKLEAILDSILDPIWQRVMGASIKVKVATLLVCGSAVAATANPEMTSRLYSQSVDLFEVVTVDQSKIPLHYAVVEKTRATATRLSITTKADLLKLANGYMTPWSTAQAAAATNGLNAGAFDKQSVTEFIRSHKAPNCDCWTELPEETNSPHCVFISGWIMASLAEMSIPASSGEIRYALKTQHDDGSWHTFDVADQPQYSSTYSTAWLLIGLVQQRAKGFIDDGEAPNVESAVTRAVGWLLAHRMQGARWKAYPELNSSVESESISAVALHALHVASPDQIAALDREWINSLKDQSVPASAEEKYYVEMEGRGARAIDHFVQLPLPWMVVATVDAFPQGDAFERSKALYWLERRLGDESVAKADADNNNWWRAELLYSLGYLLKRS
jgi:hypothetical protein